MRQLVRKVARTQVTVLIAGESGTGSLSQAFVYPYYHAQEFAQAAQIF